MFKIFNKSTTKFDVIMAAAGAIIGVWKAIDTIKDFRAEQEEKEQEK